MSYKEVSDRVARLVALRKASVNSLAKSIESKIGKNVSNDDMMSTFLLVLRELGSFYSFIELETNMIFALQREIEIVAQETTDNQEEREEFIEFLQEELLKAINNTPNNWNQS